MPRRQANRRMASAQEGQALIEFVFVLPWLLALLFLIINFAVAVNYSSDLNHVAAETARRAAVNQDGSFNAAAYATAAAESSLQDDIAVSVCLPDGTTPGGVVQIKATADYDFLQLIPGMPDFATLTLSGRAAMRLEAPADDYLAQASTSSAPCA